MRDCSVTTVATAIATSLAATSTSVATAIATSLADTSTSVATSELPRWYSTSFGSA